VVIEEEHTESHLSIVPHVGSRLTRPSPTQGKCAGGTSAKDRERQDPRRHYAAS
jgi:hypothetical protein